MLEQKVARLCWNTNRWSKPSGPKGKSRFKKSFEYEHGFGHEEWLFDTTKVIDGQHYGFIQGVGQHYEKYIGQSFDIRLYTIDSKTLDRWWVGRVSNVNVIDEAESDQIAREYRRRGWLAEMDQQLSVAMRGYDYPDFDTSRLVFFNVKFSPDALELLDPPIRFPADDPVVPSNHYNLLNYLGEPDAVVHRKGFVFQAGHEPGKGSATRSYGGGSAEVDLVEKRLQTALFDYLCKVHGASNVGAEQPTEYGTSVDVAVRHVNKKKPDSYTFYELKVLQSPRLCVRHALAQLMEYCYYPSACRASTLIIVSPERASEDVALYMKSLREQFSIPIYYQRFDVEKGELDTERV